MSGRGERETDTLNVREKKLAQGNPPESQRERRERHWHTECQGGKLAHGKTPECQGEEGERERESDTLNVREKN